MAKDDKRTLTPKLRFPEFRGGKGWKISPLAHLLSRSPEYGINAAAVPYSDNLPTYLRITDIDDDGRFITESKVSVDAKIGEDNYLNDGDVVLARTGASVGKSYRYREDDGRLVFAGYLIRVTADREKLIPTLLANYLETSQYWDWVRMTSARSGQPGINGSEYAALPIPLPHSGTDDYGLAEQQKIADCLTSLDEVIAAQGRKVEALKTHKKGLMQQLFPREGETLPRLRFPEFRNGLGWHKRRLGDFIHERSEIAEGTVPLYSLTIEEGVTAKTDRYERSFLVANKEDAYKLVLPNDFAFNPMNLRFGAIGRHSGSEPVALSKYYNIFFCDESADPRFCEIYFRSDGMVAYYDVMATGTLIEKRRVHFDRFLSFSIAFPQIEEQERVADCFFTLDVRIAAEADRLAALKTHKKGLMQQLFPSPEGD